MSTLSDDSSRVPEMLASPVLLAAIVNRAKSGHHRSFEILHMGFGRLVLSLLRRLTRDEDTAADLCQDTFVSAWVHLSELHDASTFKAWLCRIATNLALDHIRRKEKLNFLPLPQDEVQEYSMSEFLSVASPEKLVGDIELIELTLAQLPRRSRICIILSDHCGYSLREIAEQLSITEKCVSAYLSRGRKQFCQVYRLLKGAEPSVKKKGGATL
jgi:RNA polymerase sigma-70 factor, ECF subfamily